MTPLVALAIVKACIAVVGAVVIVVVLRRDDAAARNE